MPFRSLKKLMKIYLIAKGKYKRMEGEMSLYEVEEKNKHYRC